MKAKVLGKLDPKIISKADREIAKSLQTRTTKWLGEVEPIALSLTNPYMMALLDFGAKYGFKYKETRLYTGPCLLPLDGTVLWHDDSGIGHLLCWVLEVRKFGRSFDESRNTPALLSQTGREVEQLESLVPGTVFVFNGDVGHAWLSNESCLLAQVTVSPIRGKLRQVADQ